MRNRLLFPAGIFAATTLLMALQKPLFLALHGAGTSAGDWRDVILHGLKLDLTMAGYVTAPVLLLLLLTPWVTIPGRTLRGIVTGWLAAASVLTAAIFAVDIALYGFWGFRIDSTVLIYLSDPREAMASVEWRLGVRQTLLFAAWSAASVACYLPLVRRLDAPRLPLRRASIATLALLLMSGADFLAIRGGTGTSVANISKVCFSPVQLLNHAAINPVFSLLSSLGDSDDYASEYPFFDEETRAARFDALRSGSEEPLSVLRTKRPDVAVIILESFARTFMDARVDGTPVMQRMQQLKSEGIWFENFFANSFRTDRGEVAILSGFPAQTRISVMKLPAKSRSLPSLARTLSQAGYATGFTYGGDLNFTNQASYMYATGWQELVWQKDMHFDVPTSKWGYDDRVVCDWFARQLIARSEGGGSPFLAGLLTLSSHEPFEVPFSRFDDRTLNAMAFTDDCVGRMIDSLKASPAWDNLLVVLVADHAYPYPKGLAHNVPLRHRIPMIWTGGAIDGPRTVERYGSQIDLAATLLGQLGLPHDDFPYSKDLFAADSPAFAYYVFNEGFGVVDASGEALWDAASERAEGDERLLDIGRTLLQTTYADIGRR